MIINRTVLVCLAAAVAVVGCGKKRVAPPTEKSVTLLGKKGVYRDWSQTSPCDVEPRTLKGDAESMNALLNEVLGQTSADENGVWSDEQVALLEDGPMLLPAALGANETLVKRAAGCAFVDADGVKAPLKTLEELTAQTRRRLELSATLLPKLKAKAALAKWKEGLPAAVTAAKAEWCAAKPKPGAVPDIFFAFEDETGKTEWHFCDGCKVVAAAGKPPALEPSATAHKKKPKDKPYLDGAAKYPASDVQRAPKLPAAAAPAEPAKGDVLDPNAAGIPPKADD